MEERSGQSAFGWHSFQSDELAWSQAEHTAFFYGKATCLRSIPLPGYQKRHSADSFKLLLQRVVSLLRNRMQRLGEAGRSGSSRSKTERDKHGKADDLVEETEELLRAALAAQLALFRVGVLYPWHEPFGKGLRAMLYEEVFSLAESLAAAWDFLGVSGEARRHILQRLLVEVGQQTLEVRQRINKEHSRRLRGRLGTAGDIRGSAALHETQGEG